MSAAPPILVVFHSGAKELLDAHVESLRTIDPSLPLFVIAENQPRQGRWFQWYPYRTFRQNLQRTRDHLRGRRIRFASVMLQPGQPYWHMRFIAMLLGRSRLLYFNENLTHFRVHPRSARAMLRHWRWRLRNWLVSLVRPDSRLYLFFWRLYHPHEFRRPIAYELARVAGWLTAWRKAVMRPLVETVTD